MKERREHIDTVEVPKGTGRQGFLLAIDQILKLPRVQDIRIDARGKITYTRFIMDGEPTTPLMVDFDTLSPHSVIRNGEVVEVFYTPGLNPAVVTSIMFTEAMKDQLFPIAFVGGANTVLWDWHATTGVNKIANQEEFYGFPFYKDRMIEDYMLLLCAGYARGGALIDTQKSYKIIMPERTKEIR